LETIHRLDFCPLERVCLLQLLMPHVRTCAAPFGKAQSPGALTRCARGALRWSAGQGTRRHARGDLPHPPLAPGLTATRLSWHASQDGATPLHVAARSGSAEMVTQLVELGAEVDAKDVSFERS
jgi:hypothetical protein